MSGLSRKEAWPVGFRMRRRTRAIPFLYLSEPLLPRTPLRSNTRGCTAKARAHRGKGSENIKAVHLLSRMNDGPPGAPSDEGSRKCLQADLAPQS